MTLRLTTDAEGRQRRAVRSQTPAGCPAARDRHAKAITRCCRVTSQARPTSFYHGGEAFPRDHGHAGLRRDRRTGGDPKR